MSKYFKPVTSFSRTSSRRLPVMPEIMRAYRKRATPPSRGTEEYTNAVPNRTAGRGQVHVFGQPFAREMRFSAEKWTSPQPTRERLLFLTQGLGNGNLRLCHDVCELPAGDTRRIKDRSPPLLVQIIHHHPPRHVDSDQTSKRTDQKCAHQSEANVLACPPTDIAANRHPDKHEQTIHGSASRCYLVKYRIIHISLLNSRSMIISQVA